MAEEKERFNDKKQVLVGIEGAADNYEADFDFDSDDESLSDKSMISISNKQIPFQKGISALALKMNKSGLSIRNSFANSTNKSPKKSLLSVNNIDDIKEDQSDHDNDMELSLGSRIKSTTMGNNDNNDDNNDNNKNNDDRSSDDSR